MAYLDNFNYQILGNPGAPQLVFLHGLMGYGANWRKITSFLQQDYQILLYDQRGHGRSFQPATGYRPEDYAEDLRLLLQELSWGPVFLVGHSMGGRNALNFAVRFKDLVRALVVEDIGPESSQRNVERLSELIEGVPTPFASRQEARAFFKGEFLQKFKDRRNVESIALYLYSNIVDNEKGLSDWRFSKAGVLASLQLGRVSDRWNEVKSLSIPTLWIRGKDSEEFSHQTYLQVLAANPRIEGLEIPQAGHWVHADQPEAFARAIGQFFKANEGE